MQHTDHGYGDHENRDELGMIHMGGRTYDPALGQMMQADAVVQSPLNGQNYNRYAYVFNNPMSYIDPTGFVSEFASRHFSSFSRSSFASNFTTVREHDSDSRRIAEDMMSGNDQTSGVSEVILVRNGQKNYVVSTNSLSRITESGTVLVGFDEVLSAGTIEINSARDSVTICSAARACSSATEAAINAIKIANPLSIQENLEYFGFVYRNRNGEYGFTPPLQGEIDFSPLKEALPYVPMDALIVGDYHTHGDYTRIDDAFLGVDHRVDSKDRDDFASDEFSPGDIYSLDSLELRYPGYRGYLGTPSGSILIYDPNRKESYEVN